MADRTHLIKKDGHYYRPNRSGYTTHISEAGLYTKDEAEREAAIEPWHMKAIARADVPADQLEEAAVKLDQLRIEANHHKARNHAKAALLRRMRDRLALITDAIEDEGDRAYFGSTNDADDLRDFANTIRDWRWDEIFSKDEGLSDPFAMLREQRARAEKAEAELAKIEAMLTEGQGEDCGLQILPDFTEDMTTAAKVEACLQLLEKRRDVIEATFSATAGG